MILVIDNYDSFTFNLVHYLIELGADVRVERNDALTATQALATGADAILISPGPCTPNEAGISLDIVAACADAARPLLGVCLGHQAIGQHFGGTVQRGHLMHGKTSPVCHDNSGLYTGLPSPFQATRYHSLVIRRETFTNPDFIVCAWTAEGEIMGVRHRTWPLHGVQFHPESFLTAEGPKLLRNFVEMRAG